ncbi:putative fatty acid activator Faa4 [Hypoxylon cercidicola]|nr:putative fatty acid activator Faa4 [Hypoxylon cercidicola]
MSLLRSFRNLSPRARAGVGLGLLAWGAIGLQLSDRAEERYGLAATEDDKAALAKVLPRITAVEREVGRGDQGQNNQR